MGSEEQEWIEAPDGWGPNEEHQDNDNGSGLLDLFGNDDPHDLFTFNIKINNGTTKTIRLTGFKLGSDETDRSTGVTIWQAAPRLADYLQEHSVMCEGKSVLELGAGLGLCGITAYYLGAKIIMTDGDTHVLQKLRENVRQNCGSGDNDAMTADNNAIECRQLLWGSPHMEKFSELEKFDTILGADVIYTEASIPPLFDTVAFFLKKPRGRFVLSRYNKWSNVDDEVIIKAAKERFMHCTKGSEGIYIFHWNETEENEQTDEK
mmetsp:Transcript_8633/g.15140  ORF Transcript_8633/g.15140 Transcript_8633/m.15140 type:complete len:263 (-) Transcript_8633:249-1037(-)